MAVTPSSMKMNLGAQAPDFGLPDYDKKIHRLSDFKESAAIVVMFVCNHCPYVVHVRQGIAVLAQDYTKKNVAFVAINSNDIVNYPEDSPEKMKIFASESRWKFPYLFDETQKIAKAYHAACTPDFFLFDKNHRLAYRGQMDDARPGNDVPVTGKNLREALDAVLQNNPVPQNQKPSMGCNIKWK